MTGCEATLDAFDDQDFGQRARRLRVDTLIWLRWLAIVGQTAAILTAHYALGLQFPVLACFVCVAASVVVNAGLRVRFPVSHRLDDSWAIYVLAYDLAQLAALLALSGGLANPFSFLFLAPIMTAAVALPLRRTLTLLAFALACATALQFWSVTLRWPDGTAFEPPTLYVVGNVDQHRRQRRLYRHLRQPDRRGGAAAHQRADRHRAHPRPPAALEPARRHRRRRRPRIGHAARDRRAGRPRPRRPAADRRPMGRRPAPGGRAGRALPHDLAQAVVARHDRRRLAGGDDARRSDRGDRHARTACSTSRSRSKARERRPSRSAGATPG